MNGLQIPRQVLCPHAVIINVYGFADASAAAYGACVYIQCVDNKGRYSTQLLCAKSKVAPLKTVSIPRLELCAALTLSKLIKKVNQFLRLPDVKNYFLWSDSTIVLCWLASNPTDLKPFVGNRVSEIHELTSEYNWQHVRTNDNPADLISRGVSSSILLNSSLWWKGPDWLCHPQSEWPTLPKPSVPENLPETKICKAVFLSKFSFENYLFNKFSTYTRLQRVLSYIKRFINNCRVPMQNRLLGPLQTSELKSSLLQMVIMHQRICYPEEIKSLKRLELVHKSSNLAKLNPFLDEDGIIRVGGRLQNSNFNFEKKHPIVICSKHVYSIMLFRYLHLKHFHAGPQHLLSLIREGFWPIRGRHLARKTYHECVACFRVKPQSITQFMGNLPKYRLTPSFPFEICGVDYAGPFSTKDKRGRGCRITKSYACIFICFNTRAIHIELVSSLTTDCFLIALKRFISRRGTPTEIFSDNGTNFVGANNVLRELGEFIKAESSNIIENMSQVLVKWHFIPPQSPNFGGLWEAEVKSLKFHLRRVVGNCSLVYEDLNTVVIQIEAILNSRPLCPLSNDPSDLNSLTPAHFLLGRCQNAILEEDVSKIRENRLNAYQHLLRLKQDFWKRWHREYICELQQRSKWNKSIQVIKKGDMVLIKDDNLPPLKWKMGRIDDVFKGKDGIVRVVNVLTSSGVLKRAVSKICLFPSAGDIESPDAFKAGSMSARDV